MDEITLESEVRTIIDAASARLLRPRAGECLTCYVFRQLGEFGCDGTHRFALSYRDRTAPRATALLSRLARMGACCCDCEMFLNAYALGPRPWLVRDPFGEVIGIPVSAEELTGTREPEEAPEAGLPPDRQLFLCCRFVRRGSTQPCANWRRLR